MQIWSIDDLTMFNYFEHLAKLFKICSIYLQILLIIFSFLTLIICTKRSFFVLGTIMIFLDNILTFIATYAMSTPVKNQPSTINEIWWYYFIQNSLAFILMMIYVYARWYIDSKLTDRYPWQESSSIFRCLYVIKDLFFYTIAPMLLVNSGLIFIIGLVLNSWKTFLSLSEILFI